MIPRLSGELETEPTVAKVAVAIPVKVAIPAVLVATPTGLVVNDRSGPLRSRPVGTNGNNDIYYAVKFCPVITPKMP